MRADNNTGLETLLRVCIRLLAAQVGADLPLSERAPLLARLGLDRVSIAQVCDTTPEIVSVRIAEARKRNRTGSRHRKGQRPKGK
jgi:hypothetical protein